MRTRLLLLISVLLPALLNAKDEPDHAESGHQEHAATKDHKEHESEGHDHENEEGKARFEPGFGLELAAETSESLGLKTEPAQRRILAPQWEVTATVFEAGPPARAVSFHNPEVAAGWSASSGAPPRIQKVNTSAQNALAQSEVLWDLPGAPNAGSTVTFTFRGPERVALAIPARALLRTATGTFVYVQKAEHYLLTPVRTGAAGKDDIEIVEGLNEGTPLVVEGTETLWLTELRLTKGGGHSH